MLNIDVKLESKIDEKNYFINRACSSVDLNIDQKLTHHVKIDNCSIEDYNIGLIIGLSGSRKTTLANKYFKNENDFEIDPTKSIIEQFDDKYKYDERAEILSKFGLSSIPEWIKPFGILSNGEKSRAEIALKVSNSDKLCVIDEYTSVVDRTVAKIMSVSINKYIKKHNKRIILISVHKDIIDWLNPDWIIDVDNHKFIDRRLLQQSRTEKLNFTIKECSRKSWDYFSKYHYLSDNLAGGKLFHFGIFDENDKQIGYTNFANYNPKFKRMFHSNRTVIHPEYCGIGLGIHLINVTSQHMRNQGYDIRAKFSNAAVCSSMMKDKNWIFIGKSNNLQKCQFVVGGNISNKTKQRKAVTTYQFKFVGENSVNKNDFIKDEQHGNNI